MDSIETGLEKALAQMRKIKHPYRTEKLVSLQSMTEELLKEMRQDEPSTERINELTEQINTLS